MLSEKIPELAERVTELEISLAHQQRLCEQLNDVVIEHTRTLMRFELLIPKLEQQIKELRNIRKLEQESPHDERPPHY